MQMKRGGHLIPRRSLLRLGGAASAMFAAGRALPQSFSWDQIRLRFKLLKEMKNAVLMAMAPDCGRMCIWLTKKPIGRFILRANGDRRGVDQDPPSSGTLTIVEIGTWKEIFSTPLAGEPMEFSFFAGGDALYGVTEPQSLSHKLSGRVAMVIDLRSGEVKRLPAPATADTIYYSALRDRTLIGVRDDHALLLAEWPSLREPASATVKGRMHGGVSLTADGRRLIHVVDQSLVCRRTEDFAVLWHREIDASIDMSATLNGRGVPGPSLSVAYPCFSADGSTVALGARRVNSTAAPVEFYIEILNGNNGGTIVRWPKNPGDGVTLSADGKLLAVAELAEVGNDLEAMVHMYQVPSGREVATGVHDRVARSRRLGATMHGSTFGFTEDGKYFVTGNSYKVRIWQIERG